MNTNAINKIRIINSIVFSVRSNQSLKLTEIAVDYSTRAQQPVSCWTGLISRGLAPSLRRFAAAA